ncbi:3500_t:CDS:2, partial [Diversispora eburnea]
MEQQRWNKAMQELSGNNQSIEGLINSWLVVTSWLDPKRINSRTEKEVPSEVNKSLENLRHTPLAKRIVEWYLDVVNKNIIENFDIRLKDWREDWKYHNNHYNNDGGNDDHNDNNDDSKREQELENWISESYSKIIHDIYLHYKNCERPFLFMNASEDIKEEGIIIESTTTTSLQYGEKEIINHIKNFNNICEEMHTLKLIQRTKDKIEEMLCERIEQKILNTCKGNFNKPMLRYTSKWLYSIIYPWLYIILSSDTSSLESLIE